MLVFTLSRLKGPQKILDTTKGFGTLLCRQYQYLIIIKLGCLRVCERELRVKVHCCCQQLLFYCYFCDAGGGLLLLLLSHFSHVWLCHPIDGSPPGSPAPGILQARTLEWVAISFSNAWKWKVKVKSLSHIQLLATPWTAAHQAPPSMGFSRQECWNGVPLLHNYNPQMRKWLGWVVIHGSSHFVLPYPFPWLPAILWDCDRKVHPSFSFWRLGCRGQVLWSFWGQLGTERRFFFSVYIKISSIEFEIHCEMQHTRLLHLL